MRSLVVGLEVAGVAQGKLEDQRHKWLSPPPLPLFLSSGFYLPALYSTGAETIRLHAYTSLGIFIPLSTFEGVPPRLCLSLIPYTSQTESLFCPSRPIFSRPGSGFKFSRIVESRKARRIENYPGRGISPLRSTMRVF